MGREQLSEQNEINEFLNANPQWILKGNSIVREMVAANFAAAVGIINSIAVLAEKKDHHPEIFLYGYNKVRISLTTYDKGGLTELDFQLAIEIDELGF